MRVHSYTNELIYFMYSFPILAQQQAQLTHARVHIHTCTHTHKRTKTPHKTINNLLVNHLDCSQSFHGASNQHVLLTSAVPVGRFLLWRLYIVILRETVREWLIVTDWCCFPRDDWFSLGIQASSVLAGGLPHIADGLLSLLQTGSDHLRSS